MARFENIGYLEFGKYIRELIADPVRIAQVKSGELDLKEELKGFMTPIGVPWENLKIIAHFDKADEVNIAFPFTGDVEGSAAALSPPDGADGEAYLFPLHYQLKPNDGADAATRNKNRLTAYLSRLGDYVMTRCK